MYLAEVEESSTEKGFHESVILNNITILDISSNRFWFSL